MSRTPRTDRDIQGHGTGPVGTVSLAGTTVAGTTAAGPVARPGIARNVSGLRLTTW